MWQSDPCKKTGQIRNREIYYEVHDEVPEWFEGNPWRMLHRFPKVCSPPRELPEMVSESAKLGRDKNNKIRP